jgi:hypothetical protein
VVSFEQSGFRVPATASGGRITGTELTILTFRPGVGTRWLA